MNHYTVWEITNRVKNFLESSYSSIEVEGEISNCRFSSTGHLYFSLKDDKAKIQCVLFRSALGRVPFMPEDGQMVTAAGGLSIYPPSGSYQLICRGLKLAGEGHILKLLEERKRQFSELGYFDIKKKKKLPRFPRRVGIITSQEGAALRDILNVLERRNSRIHITILPVPVQGLEASKKIARQIMIANKKQISDVLIVTRGGGSIEDLLPFSSEEVVKAIYDSKIPVVSGVGHEIDWALSDFAADVRAPTPSAAAELVTGEMENLLAYLREAGNELIRSAWGYVELKRLEVSRVSTRNLASQILRHTGQQSFHIDSIKQSIISRVGSEIQNTKTRVSLLKTELTALSPSSILQKGYAMVSNIEDGGRLFSARKIKKNQELRVTMHDGSFETVVTNTGDNTKDN